MNRLDKASARVASQCSAVVALALVVSSCGPAGNDPGPGGVSVDEAKALDEAAEMIELRRLPEGAIDATPDPADLPPPDETPATPEQGADPPSE